MPMISITKGITLRSFGAYKSGLVAHHSSSMRLYSAKGGFKEINRRINRYGEENTKESEVALSVLRRLGGVSVIVVLCLILWASSRVDNPVLEPVEIPDLSKDVRDT